MTMLPQARLKEVPVVGAHSEIPVKADWVTVSAEMIKGIRPADRDRDPSAVGEPIDISKRL